VVSALNVVKFVTGDLQENCFIAWTSDSTEAVVFDPGWDGDKIIAELERRKLNVCALLQTHCHGDHIGALEALKKRFPAAPIYCPEDEVDWLEGPTLNLSYFYGFSIVAPPADVQVKHGDVITVGGMAFKALHVPGHSPGGTGYFVEPENGAPHLFGGDILFKGSIGRTDLPGGEGEDVLVEGIREHLFVLPDATIVHPGHGPDTTIGQEKRSNPFCGLG
jgi:glyoxylase-like metal-dependent hydrolase (beta-lactamase superfamily II)